MKSAASHQYINQHSDRIRHELFEFLRIPSISADPSYRSQIRDAAVWTANQAKRLGFDTMVDATRGHPVVLARRIDQMERPALLIYGHYDVQPADPYQEWTSEPFSPEIRDGFIYARGANDDKGQIFTVLKAIEAMLAEHPVLPVNLILVVEGEEEIGSPHFEAWLTQRSQECSSDAVVILDGHQYARGIPSINYGLRGMCYLQVDLSGPRFDLHSGVYGGCLANPVNVLTTLLSRLKDDQGQVSVPHFYDRVNHPVSWEREELATLPFDEERLCTVLGVKALTRERGYTTLESMLMRPTLDVCGIWGGYTGEGAKTIIPAKSGAKVSMRLVPDQDPSEIAQLVSSYLRTLLPPGVELKITEFSGIKPFLVTRDSTICRTMHRSIEQQFERPPVYVRMGGSVGVANMFKDRLNCENILITGWSCPDDQAHSPNERLSVADFERGIHTMIDCISLYPLSE